MSPENYISEYFSVQCVNPSPAPPRWQRTQWVLWQNILNLLMILNFLLSSLKYYVTKFHSLKLLTLTIYVLFQSQRRDLGTYALPVP